MFNILNYQENSVRTTLRILLIPVRMDKIKKKKLMRTNSAMVMGKGELLLITGGDANWCHHHKNQCGDSSKFGSTTRAHCTTQRLISNHRDTGLSMFIAASFTIILEVQRDRFACWAVENNVSIGRYYQRKGFETSLVVCLSLLPVERATVERGVEDQLTWKDSKRE